MEDIKVNDQSPDQSRPSLSVSQSEKESDKPVIPPANPEGVLRAIGSFRGNPLLGELMKAIRKQKEDEKATEKAA